MDFGAIDERKNHLITPQLPGDRVEQVKEAEDQYPFVIKMNSRIEIVASCTDVSRAILQCAVDSKVMNGSAGGHNDPITALFYPLQMANPPRHPQPEAAHIDDSLSQGLGALSKNRHGYTVEAAAWRVGLGNVIGRFT